MIAFSIWTEESDPNQGTWVAQSDGSNARKVSDFPTRVVWDHRSGDLLQLRRSEADDAIELWQASPSGAQWTKRSRLELGIRPPIQIEFLPLSVDPGTGRLVMNRRIGTSRLLIIDGVDVARW